MKVWLQTFSYNYFLCGNVSLLCRAGIYLGIQLLGRMNPLFWTFWEMVKLFPRVAKPLRDVWGFQFHHIFADTWQSFWLLGDPERWALFHGGRAEPYVLWLISLYVLRLILDWPLWSLLTSKVSHTGLTLDILSLIKTVWQCSLNCWAVSVSS